MTFFKLGKQVNQYFNGDIDLVEIYNTTLTAEEVSLLYNKKLYRKPVFEQEQALGRELHTSANAASDPNGNETNSTTGFGSLNGTLTSQSDIVNVGNFAIKIEAFATLGRFYINLNQSPNLTSGVRYKLSFDARHIGVGGLFKIGLGAGSAVDGEIVCTLSNTDTSFVSYSTKFTHGANSLYFAAAETNATNDGGVYFDNFSVKEITRESLTPLLNINPLGCVLEDKYGNSITNTDVTMFRQGRGYVGKYNGSTSKLNSSNIILGIGDISILIWVKLHGWGGNGGRGYIMTNKKLVLFVDTDADRLRLTSNSISYAGTSTNALSLGKWICVGITRTSSGLATFYLDGILNSTPNQNSGTPGAGITDFTIGNSYAQTAAFDGLIGEVQIIQGILTVSEIQNYYNATKKDYLG